MAGKNTHFILNPAAGGGRAGKLMPKLIPEIEKKYGTDYVLHVTGGTSDATRIAMSAADAGAGLIVAAGGDGTINEVLNGLFRDRAPINPDCELGIIDFGTGRGLAQTLDLPSSHREQLNIIFRSQGFPVDVGLVTFADKTGSLCERLFISECQLGIGSSVACQVNSVHKLFGGKIAFGLSALIQIFLYRANRVTLQIDEEYPDTEELIGLVIGNGTYCAGGMKLTPGAKPDDGYLDILSIRDMSIPQRILNFPKIYSGNHIFSEHFAIRQNKTIRINSAENLMIEADGELLGTLPCQIEIIPSIIKVKYKSNSHGNHQ